MRRRAPLLPPTLSYVVLTLLGVAVPPLVAGVKPWSSDAALLEFFQHHNGAAHAGAFFTLGAAIRALYGITFAAGGPAFVMFSGLLLLGVSIPGLLGRVLPRAVGWGGIAIAAVCELGALAVAFDGADFLLPIGRFGGLVWMIAVAVTLPATRRELRARKGIVRAADQDSQPSSVAR